MLTQQSHLGTPKLQSLKKIIPVQFSFMIKAYLIYKSDTKFGHFSFISELYSEVLNP